MKKNDCLYKVAILACCSTFSFSGYAAINPVTLQQAIKANYVLMTATGNGGALGKCLTLHLRNITHDAMTLQIDQAMIFTPSDASYQNLVAVGGDYVDLQPNITTDMVLQTFCGKSFAWSPVANLKYDFWQQGDDNMIKTMDYIKTHELFNSIGQHAVWTFTNNHNLSTIYSTEEPAIARTLLTYVAELRGMPIPDYYTTFNINDRPGQGMIDMASGQQVVEMTWGNEGYRNMYITIYKENGEVYRSGISNEVCNAWGHTAFVTFDPQKEKGHYFVSLHDDANKVWSMKEIRVGIDWNGTLNGG